MNEWTLIRAYEALFPYTREAVEKAADVLGASTCDHTKKIQHQRAIELRAHLKTITTYNEAQW